VKARLAAASVAVAALLVVALPIAPRSSHAHRAPVAVPNPPAMPGGFSKRTFTDHGVVYHYQVFFPRDYDSTIHWPVIIALHGSSEKGSDGEKQVGVGVGPVVRQQWKTFPAIVVFPQVPSEGQVQMHAAPIARLVDAVVRDVHGDTNHVYLTGLSFGGVLAYLVAREQPGRYAALVQVSAPLVIQPGDRSTRLFPAAAGAEEARSLGGTSVWIFQGARDVNVPAAATREVVQSMTRAGVHVRYTEYADEGHEIWDRVYRDATLWRWLFEQHR
jgi:predicted peptidase